MIIVEKSLLFGNSDQYQIGKNVFQVSTTFTLYISVFNGMEGMWYEIDCTLAVSTSGCRVLNQYETRYLFIQFCILCLSNIESKCRLKKYFSVPKFKQCLRFKEIAIKVLLTYFC